MTLLYVVVVDIKLRSPADLPEFRKMIDENAAASARLDRRFDVVAPFDGQDCILLYESYDSEVAFAAHLDTDHYRAFSLASARLSSKERSVWAPSYARERTQLHL